MHNFSCSGIKCQLSRALNRGYCKAPLSTSANELQGCLQAYPFWGWTTCLYLKSLWSLKQLPCTILVATFTTKTRGLIYGFPLEDKTHFGNKKGTGWFVVKTPAAMPFLLQKRQTGFFWMHAGLNANKIPRLAILQKDKQILHRGILFFASWETEWTRPECWYWRVYILQCTLH